MDRFLIKLANNPNKNWKNDRNYGSNNIEDNETISQKVIENNNIKRKYRDEYFKYGFISIEQNSIEKSFCIICYKILENNAFIPAKLNYVIKVLNFLNGKKRSICGQQNE